MTILREEVAVSPQRPEPVKQSLNSLLGEWGFLKKSSSANAIDGCLVYGRTLASEPVARLFPFESFKHRRRSLIVELVENQQTWIQLKGALEKRLSPQVWATWINQIKCLQDDGKTLRIGLPDTFSLNWVKDHYRHVIEEELETIGSIDLQFDIHEHLAATKTNGAEASPNQDHASEALQMAKEALKIVQMHETAKAVQPKMVIEAKQGRFV